MSNMIAAANPTAPLDTPEQAEAAARSSAWGAWLGAAVGVLGSAVTYMQRDTIIEVTRQAMEQEFAKQGTDPAQAEAAMAMASGGFMFGIGVTLFFAVVYVILGFVQWKKPNVVIPIILLLLTALNVLMTVYGLVSSPASMALFGPAQIIVFLLTLVTLVLHWAGLRGALAHRRFVEMAGG